VPTTHPSLLPFIAESYLTGQVREVERAAKLLVA